jgi:hypothetical protein
VTLLTVHCRSDMGPLEVSVYPPEGDAIEFVLSSGRRSWSRKVDPGRYAVVARRPNGSRLQQVVVVGRTAKRVDLGNLVGHRPNEFLTKETLRGQVVRDLGASVRQPWRALVEGAAGDALDSAALGALAHLTPDSTPATRSRGSLRAREKVAWSALRKVERSKFLSLRLWTIGGSRGAEAEVVRTANISSEFLKIALQPRGEAVAIGLLDEHGFGPIVNVAPFAEPVEITFLAKGLVVRAVDRDTAAAGQRVPVALTTPSNAAAADMLAALAAPGTPPAQEIWDQAAPGLAPRVDIAIKSLWEKFNRPAEALVAAHFLLRFLPAKLPIAWADNLKRALPAAADGPVIAAWARILNRPAAMSDEAFDREIEANVILALKRPATLFARTRALLFDALRLVSEETAARGWQQVADFRRFGADAGGLESFWGGKPTLPGKAAPAQSGAQLAQVELRSGAFNAMTQGSGAPLPLRGRQGPAALLADR